MAVFTVTHKQLTDNYALLQLLTPTDIAVGQSITVAGVGAPFNGTFIVYDCPNYEFTGIDNEGDLLFDYEVIIENQVLFACTGTDTERIASAGTITYNQNCTWVTVAELITYLGVDIVNPSDDYTLATQARNAANDFCYRRRQESGYFDSLTTSPGHDVTLGTLMYAAALWRSRGSTQETFSTFDGMGSAPVSAMTPVIKQLLGIDRPQVA
jgi:hypothetical protein